MAHSRMMLAVAAAGLIVLSACAGSGEWQQEGVEASQRDAHLAACQREARKVTERDALIDQDIESAQEMNFGTLPTTQSLNQTNQFGEEKRFERMVEGCMRRLGYQKVGGEGWL